MRRDFFLFLAAGGVAAAANFGSRFVFSLWFSYPVAIVIAYLVGMVTAFVLMRQYVFSGQGGAIGAQAVKFTLVNLLAVAQTLVVSIVLARWLLPASEWSKMPKPSRICSVLRCRFSPVMQGIVW
jgi:putative flippase GtrA